MPIPVPLIALTGRRHVGKTKAADHLVGALGFVRVHPLSGGKAAAAAYFMHLGAGEADAQRMVDGDLHDRPSPYLPGMACPRLFLEKFGRFMGATMGPAWTLAPEIARMRATSPGRPLVVESLVYEEDAIRDAGGMIVRIVRPDHDGPAGCESDARQDAIVEDAQLVNDGDLAALRTGIARIAQGMLGGR